jgi:hypothetical protein
VQLVQAILTAYRLLYRVHGVIILRYEQLHSLHYARDLRLQQDLYSLVLLLCLMTSITITSPY